MKDSARFRRSLGKGLDLEFAIALNPSTVIVMTDGVEQNAAFPCDREWVEETEEKESEQDAHENC